MIQYLLSFGSVSLSKVHGGSEKQLFFKKSLEDIGAKITQNNCPTLGRYLLPDLVTGILHTYMYLVGHVVV